MSRKFTDFLTHEDDLKADKKKMKQIVLHYRYTREKMIRLYLKKK